MGGIGPDINGFLFVMLIAGAGGCRVAPGDGAVFIGCALTGSQSLAVGVGVAAFVGSENPRN